MTRLTCCLLLAWVTFATAAELGAGDDPRVPVPATDEITLLDPRVSADGKPTPIVLNGSAGQPLIDIPPTVVVHNFYYTGDRDFRGPRMPGGPCVVVVSHPATGERLYLDVQMLPGSPRVIYREDRIEYDFGRDRIRIEFRDSKLFGRCATKVSYDKGNDKVLREPARSQALLNGGAGPATSDKAGLGHSAKNMIGNASLGLRKATQAVTAPAANVVRATPVGSLFKDPTEKLATEQRDLDVQRAAAIKDQLDLTIPTNR